MEEPSKQNRGIYKHLPLFLMCAIAVAISFLLFSDLSKSATVDAEKTIEPHVLSTSGTTLIVRDKVILISKGWTGSIRVGDRIRTRIASSATVFWPDGSVTRLWEKSSIQIKEMRADANLEKTQIDFSLEQGRSWSNVVRYLFKDSHFHERYNDDRALATVRWTVFEIDLDRKYIHTVDHAVTLQDILGGSGSSILAAGAIIDSESRKMLTREVIDEEWNKLNQSEDIAYINARLERFNQSVLSRFGKKNYFNHVVESLGIKTQTLPIDEIMRWDEDAWNNVKKLVKKDSSKAHEDLISLYQEINAFPNTPEYLSTKMRLRDLIIETAPKDDQASFTTDFARLTLYDTWSAEKAWSGVTALQEKLQEYVKKWADRTLIDRLDASFKNKSLQDWDTSVENLKQKTLDSLKKKNYMDEIIKPIPSENLDTINDKATEIRKSLIDRIKNKLWQ